MSKVLCRWVTGICRRYTYCVLYSLPMSSLFTVMYSKAQHIDIFLSLSTDSVSMETDVILQESQCDVYDPCFLLPVLSKVIVHENLIDCRMFAKAGLLSYLLLSLSSHCQSIRNLSAGLLASYYEHTEGK